MPSSRFQRFICEKGHSVPPKIGCGRAIFWPQDVVRRCAMAMKESGSRDWYHLARVGLEAAMANDMELIALLETPMPARRAARGTAFDALRFRQIACECGARMGADKAASSLALSDSSLTIRFSLCGRHSLYALVIAGRVIAGAGCALGGRLRAAQRKANGNGKKRKPQHNALPLVEIDPEVVIKTIRSNG